MFSYFIGVKGCKVVNDVLFLALLQLAVRLKLRVRNDVIRLNGDLKMFLSQR